MDIFEKLVANHAGFALFKKSVSAVIDGHKNVLEGNGREEVNEALSKLRAACDWSRVETARATLGLKQAVMQIGESCGVVTRATAAVPVPTEQRRPPRCE